MDPPGENLSPNSTTEYLKINTRYNGRVKKRKWEDKPRNAEAGASETKQACSNPIERIKKKKIAMLLSYSGADYHGMQRNPGTKTIEEELFKALLTTKNIVDESFNQVQTIQFQRAARTDKGVSAVRQIVSMKMPTEVSIPEINQHLPPEIRVFSIKRVTKGFNSKTQCDARTYSYTMPTYAFDTTLNEAEQYKSFRISENVINKINELLKDYKGTKNFHNFTSKKDFIDPSSRRFIISFECGKPFVSEDLEFITLTVKGQSFILHQIRKMVGIVIAIIRGAAESDVIQKALTSDQIDIPMAPGLGLILEQVHYDRYDQRYGEDGVHEKLTWNEVEDEIIAFKEKYIFPNIVKTELEEWQMASWLETLGKYTFKKRETDRKFTAISNQEDGGGDECENDDDDDECDNISEDVKDKIEA